MECRSFTLDDQSLSGKTKLSLGQERFHQHPLPLPPPRLLLLLLLLSIDSIITIVTAPLS